MQNENQVDLSAISDLSKLRELYINFNETKMLAEEQLNTATTNLQLVRQRMVELQSEIDAQAAAKQPEPDSPTE